MPRTHQRVRCTRTPLTNSLTHSALGLIPPPLLTATFPHNRLQLPCAVRRPGPARAWHHVRYPSCSARAIYFTALVTRAIYSVALVTRAPQQRSGAQGVGRPFLQLSVTRPPRAKC